jgi:hypothetical protein
MPALKGEELSMDIIIELGAGKPTTFCDVPGIRFGLDGGKIAHVDFHPAQPSEKSAVRFIAQPVFILGFALLQYATAQSPIHRLDDLDLFARVRSKCVRIHESNSEFSKPLASDSDVCCAERLFELSYPFTKTAF